MPESTRNPKDVPVYRPQDASWWLARSSQVVQATVKVLDNIREEPRRILYWKIPETEEAVSFLALVQSAIIAENSQGGLKLWALQLQTIAHKDTGNYLCN